MNPDSPTDPIESSLTALLLGELPHEQAAALHQKLAQDPELAKLYERLKHTINLVRETITSPAAQTAEQPTPLKLSDQRRQKLLQHFKTVAPKEFAPPRWRPTRWLVPVGIAATLVALVAVTMLPALSRSKSLSMGHTFGTWYKAESAAPAPPVAAVPEPPVEDVRLAFANTKPAPAAKRLSPQAGEMTPPSEGRERFKSTGSAIVLPQSSELVDATTTPSVTEGVNTWSASAANRVLYDDSSGRAGGTGGGGGVGSLGVGARGDNSAIAGRQAGTVVTEDFFSQHEMKGPSGPPNTVAGWTDDMHVEQGNMGFTDGSTEAGSKSRPLDALNNSDFAFRQKYAAAQPDRANKLADTTASAGRIERFGLNQPLDTATKSTPASPRVAPASPQEEGETIQAIVGEPQIVPSTGYAKGLNVGDVPEMGKPVDSTASAVTLQGITTFSGVKQTLMKVPTTPAPRPAAPASPEEGQPKDLPTSGLRPSRSPSFHGGILLGSPALETAPSGGDRGVAQNLPVLRSPKEDGFAGGRGGAAGAPAPSSPQETAVNESVSRQPDAIALREKLAEARPSAQGGTAPSDTDKMSKEAAGQVLDAPAPGAKIKAQFAENSQVDGKALGFDWYLGNSLENKGAIKAQGGTAPAEKAGKSAGTAGFNVAAAGTVNPSSYMYFDRAAQPGQATSDGDKVPMLGDVPAVGRLYRIRPGAAVGGGVNANLGAPASPQDVSWGAVQAGVVANNYLGVATNYQTADMFGLAQAPTTPPSSTTTSGYADTSVAFSLGAANKNLGWLGRIHRNNTTTSDTGFSTTPETRRTVPIDYAKAADISLAFTDLDRPKSEAGRADTGGGNVHSLGVVGYYNVPTTVTNAVAAAPAESASYDRSTHYRQLSQLGTEEAAKTRPYFEAKRELEELQRSRQVLDGKLAYEKIDVDLPKTKRVEIVDKAVAEPTQGPTLGERLRSALGGKVERSARVKVERDQSDIAGLADRESMAGYDPYFIQTEAELIQSEAVLGKVAEDLKLKEAWAEKKGAGHKLTTAETIQLLKQRLDLRPVKNTSLLEIGVKSDKPEEAAKIANAVAEAYKARRSEQRAQLSKAGTKALEERYAPQTALLIEAQKKVDDLRVKLNIPDTVAAGEGPATDVAARKPAAPAPVPQPEVQTAENAFSTFSLNVSDVSFKLAGASLEKGLMPEPATVRSEEFINAFDYRDPEPPPGVPVAFAWERAQYPFAQNRDLLRFSIKTAAQGRQPGRPLNLVLLLDNSGSMERADRVRIIREALRVLAEQLQPQDKLSVVTFARTPRLFADGAAGSDAGAIAMALTELTPQGGTNLEDAMNLAYQTALRHYLANGVNRVVLLTDGAANLGNVDPEALKQKVEANRKQGVALDCFGIGWEGYNDDLLEVLSRNGDGRYAFLNTPEEVGDEFAAKLAGALQVAASDVKVQVEFNPARVTAYRQIGYAKHQLTKEQFRDNTVNAAQIGAAEAGNALYTVEVNPNGTGPLCTVRVRFRVPGTADYREHAWDVPFNGDAVALEQASPAMRLAATASALSEWLASSPYAAEVTPDRLLGYVRGVPEVYGADPRPKKLEWMIRQAKSIAGK
jgi:Mg-chelatase subunit ChlD